MKPLADEKAARNYALWRLSMRNSHSLGLIEALEKREVPSTIISKLIAELKEMGYLDDPAWIASYIRSLRLRKYGYRAIGMKLYQKGIPKEESEGILNAIRSEEGEDEDERASITHLLATRYQKYNLNQRKERDKVIGALARKGYKLDDVFRVLRERHEV